MTVHGFVSLSYLGNVYDELWMESILTDAVGHAFSVSRLGLDMLASMHMPRASLLPNAVDLTRFTPAVPAANRRWAMVTRLDADKLGAVETLIAMLPELELDALDIYGDGACAERVRALADACPKPVRLMGHSTTLHEQLRRDYFGVIGLGRCAERAGVCGDVGLQPALFELIGHDENLHVRSLLCQSDRMIPLYHIPAADSTEESSDCHCTNTYKNAIILY